MTRSEKTQSHRVEVGDQFPRLELTTITDESISLPDGSGVTHLQFRRFAGCPICNLHLRSIANRLGDLEAHGIREVVVFHSTQAELRK
jgi:peroxiredoxin